MTGPDEVERAGEDSLALADLHVWPRCAAPARASGRLARGGGGAQASLVRGRADWPRLATGLGDPQPGAGAALARSGPRRQPHRPGRPATARGATACPPPCTRPASYLSAPACTLVMASALVPARARRRDAGAPLVYCSCTGRARTRARGRGRRVRPAGGRRALRLQLGGVRVGRGIVGGPAGPAVGPSPCAGASVTRGGGRWPSGRAGARRLFGSDDLSQENIFHGMAQRRRCGTEVLDRAGGRLGLTGPVRADWQKPTMAWSGAGKGSGAAPTTALGRRRLPLGAAYGWTARWLG